MIGDELGLGALGERLEVAEIVLVERRRRGDRQRHAVHDDRIARADAVQHLERLPAGHHVVLGDDLEPVDRRIAFEDIGVVLRPETQAEAEIGRLALWSGRWR